MDIDLGNLGEKTEALRRADECRELFIEAWAMAYRALDALELATASAEKAHQLDNVADAETTSIYFQIGNLRRSMSALSSFLSGSGKVAYRLRASNPTFNGAHGERMYGVHQETDYCRTEQCAIHNPSDHIMRDWEMLWRGSLGIFTRLCPHGIEHPDPDCIAYAKHLYGSKHTLDLHDCDGCCHGQE